MSEVVATPRELLDSKPAAMSDYEYYEQEEDKEEVEERFGKIRVGACRNQIIPGNTDSIQYSRKLRKHQSNVKKQQKKEEEPQPEERK